MFGLKLTLAIGTKLQAIISDMALEIQERHAVIQGMPLVNVSDRHFWFARPALVLHIIHFILFQVLSRLTKNEPIDKSYVYCVYVLMSLFDCSECL